MLGWEGAGIMEGMEHGKNEKVEMRLEKDLAGCYFLRVISNVGQRYIFLRTHGIFSRRFHPL
jgi:hypothetical protein